MERETISDSERYRVNRFFTTYVRTHALTDTQPENIMLPPIPVGSGGTKLFDLFGDTVEVVYIFSVFTGYGRSYM